MTTADDPTIWRVDDALWARLAPLLTIDKPRKKPGRPRRDDRVLFEGLIWVLRTGAQWAALPAEFGPKSTCHARFQEWVQAGAFARAWALLLAEYDNLAGLEWRWQAADGCLVKAPLGKGALGAAQATGRNPTDRGKTGTKRHLLTDGRGVPLALVLSGAHRHDMKKLAALLDARVIAPPDPADLAADPPHLCLDRGYDYEACREAAISRGYTPHIPPKARTAQPLPPPGDPARHPPRRWVVEVGHAWFNRFRRVLIRGEKQAANYLGFVQVAACLIVYRKLRHVLSLSG